MKQSTLNRVGRLTAKLAGSKGYRVGYNEEIKRVIVTLDTPVRINTRLLQEATGYKVQQNGKYIFFSKR